MDQRLQNNQENIHQFTQFQFPKKPIQILLSISAFSILFSLSPLFPLFSNRITAFSSQIFSYATDRNYIFLFCNGILAFLLKNSSAHTDQGLLDKTFDYRKSEPEFAEKTEELAREEVLEFRSEILNSHDQSEQKEEEKCMVSEEEEEEEEEEMGLMSAEELNKKCEEFIRKMREGIKLEPQTRLIMV